MLGLALQFIADEEIYQLCHHHSSIIIHNSDYGSSPWCVMLFYTSPQPQYALIIVFLIGCGNTSAFKHIKCAKTVQQREDVVCLRYGWRPEPSNSPPCYGSNHIWSDYWMKLWQAPIFAQSQQKDRQKQHNAALSW